MPAPNYMSAAPQNLGDIISMIGATLKDASPGSNSDAIAQTRNYIQQRNMARYTMDMMNQAQGMFGTAPQFTGGSPSPTVSAPAQLSPDASGAARPPGPSGGPPAGIGDLSAALAQAANQAAPAPAPMAGPSTAASYAYQAPKLVPGTGRPAANLADPATQRFLSQLAFVAPEAAKNIRENLVAAQPQMAIAPDKSAYNVKDPSIGGKIFTGVGDGQVLLRDTQGNPTGIANLNGYADAIGQTEFAKEAAKQQATAPYTLPVIKQDDGTEVQLPLSIAAPRLAQAYGGAPSYGPNFAPPTLPNGASSVAPPTAGPAGAPAIGGGTVAAPPGPKFGTSQSPAAAEIAKSRATNQGKNESDIAGARSAMQQVDDQTNMIAQNLHDMVGETQNPQTGKWAKTKPGMIGHLSTGSGTDVIEHIPFLNQAAKDLEAKIETVRNGTSFNSLQAIKGAMAAAGDGGAAGIRMTDQTSRMLGEINGSLNQDQSGPQFEATVRRHIAQLETLSRDRHALFDSQYQGIRQNTPGQTGPTANYSPATQPRTPKLQAPNYTITAIRKAGAQ